MNFLNMLPVLAILAQIPAQAKDRDREVTFEMTGRIERVTPTEVRLNVEGAVVIPHTNKAQVLTEGQLVTVTYSMHVKNIELQKNGKSPRQEPGLADPKDHIIKDDRIFYDAKN